MMETFLLHRRGLMLLAAGSAVLPAAALRAAPAAGKTVPVNTLGSDEAVAIRGYDPVAYFREGAPRKGLAAYALVHDEAVWRFASAGNAALFAADPRRYAPAYGGFCAYCTSRGYLIKIEPEAWSIVGGRLFLNYDLDTQAAWLKQPESFIARADGFWPALTDRDIL